MPKGASLHVLRHSHASLLLSEGVDLATVSERMGHSSVRTTADIYSHAIRGKDQAAAQTWDDIMQRAGREIQGRKLRSEFAWPRERREDLVISGQLPSGQNSTNVSNGRFPQLDTELGQRPDGASGSDPDRTRIRQSGFTPSNKEAGFGSNWSVRITADGAEGPPSEDGRSRETYAGYARAENFASPERMAPESGKTYSLPTRLALNQWGLGGSWNAGAERSALQAAPGKVVFRFHSRDLHMVLGQRRTGCPFASS